MANFKLEPYDLDKSNRYLAKVEVELEESRYHDMTLNELEESQVYLKDKLLEYQEELTRMDVIRVRVAMLASDNYVTTSMKNGYEGAMINRIMKRDRLENRIRSILKN